MVSAKELLEGKKEKDEISTRVYIPRGITFNDLEKHFILLAITQYIKTYKINVIRAKDKEGCKNLDEIIEMNKIYKKIKGKEYINIEKLKELRLIK